MAARGAAFKAVPITGDPIAGDCKVGGLVYAWPGAAPCSFLK